MAMQTYHKKTPEQHAKALKHFALEDYFDACGVADVSLSGHESHYAHWLKQGFHANMAWMERSAADRHDVQHKLPGAQSVIVVIKNYYTPRPEASPGTGRVSRYAWGRDYHKVLKKPLIRLAKFVESLEADTQTYSSIDTGPVLERTWAERAGIGAIGKNSLVLRRDMGSWFFIGTILTTLKIHPDTPLPDLCGTCTACLDSCPTQAIVEPYQVDSHKCISYQTIENRGNIPSELKPKHGHWLYGCDICQEVCPWNRFETHSTEADFLPRPGHANPNPDTLLAMSEEAFNEEFAGTPIRRAKYSGIKRNSLIVKDNQLTE